MPKYTSNTHYENSAESFYSSPKTKDSRNHLWKSYLGKYAHSVFPSNHACTQHAVLWHTYKWFTKQVAVSDEDSHEESDDYFQGGTVRHMHKFRFYK